MFTVKATYRNETRKFTFSESVLFPTYNELQHQLYRIFPMSHNYYLSRLIFSPDALRPGRILVGKEIHSAEDYDPRVAPLRRLWPNPLLRFTILDETPHKVPGGGSERWSLYSDLAVLPFDPSKLPSPVVPPHDGILAPNPRSFVPSSPASPPPSVTHAYPLPPRITPPPPLPSEPALQGGTAGITTCCSIGRGRADMQALISSFKEDLERILHRTLESGGEVKPSIAPVERSTSRVSGIDISSPRTSASVANVSSRWCFVCKTGFTGVWYGCIKCPWHAVCPGCFCKSHSAHTLSFGPSHIVQQRSVNYATQVFAQTATGSTTPNSASGTLQLPASEPSGSASEATPPVHHGVVCDSCNKTIMGVRHKCLDCPDYDICTSCMDSGATEEHNPFHEFFDIEIPGHVYVHTIFEGDRRPSANRQQSSGSNQTPIMQPVGTPVELPIRHSATCNLCDSAIVGERFKCVICPDFDTCSSCFGITMEQHPSHGFVRVNKPEDLMMRDSVPLRQVTHHAVCDSCRKTIRGARYKCMHPNCPDFDLCSDCEALPIPVHPLNHPMLKLRTPDTVVPTVYRVGQAQMIHELALQRPTSVSDVSESPISPSLLQNPIEVSEPKPVVPSDQVASVTVEQVLSSEEFLSPLGSPRSDIPRAVPITVTNAPSHLLVEVEDSPKSPRSTHSALDIYHQLWPRVNQEMVHLNAVKALSAGDSAIKPTETPLSLPVGPESPKELSPPSLAASSIHESREKHGTCQVSPVPSTKSIADGYRTPSSMPTNDQKYVTKQSADQQEMVAAKASGQNCLDSEFVCDANVPDGQIFPPGAEFVKGWHVMNTGGLPWPTTTEVQFVAGEMFAPECSMALRAKIGAVLPGQALDIWTGDLKAPDTPGRYVGYWRLSDGHGNFFGATVWIDLTVADHNSDRASEQSLAASSMVMPSPHPTNLVKASNSQNAPQPSLPSTKTVTDEVEDPGSDIYSVSLVSVPTSDDEDTEWQDTRTHSEPLEYVVLYDSHAED